MNITMDGKKIKYIGWVTDEEVEPSVEEDDMRLSATYHGDHDEFWAVVYIDGKEDRRYNCKTIDTIVWNNA